MKIFSFHHSIKAKLALFVITSLSSQLAPSAPIILDQAAVDSLRIQTIIAEPIDFSETLFAIGRIEPIPARKSVLSSRVPGRIVGLHAYEGDRVETGQAIVEIESLQPGNPPPRITLAAPNGGMIMQSHSHLGKPVVPDNELFEIIDLSEVYAVARLPETQAGRIELGTMAEIEVAALPGRVFQGELVRYGTTANLDSGTIDAHFVLKNQDFALRPNMRVEFNIVLDSKHDTLSVPKNSVQSDGIRQFVFLEDPDLPNAFTKTLVTTGSRNDLQIEILQGITPGDKIVTRGAYSLMFAGSGSVSLKDALDAAHGHAHNEDGSEMGDEDHHDHDHEEGEHSEKHESDHDHEGGPWILFLSLLSGLLFVLLVLSLSLRRKNAA